MDDLTAPLGRSAPPPRQWGAAPRGVIVAMLAGATLAAALWIATGLSSRLGPFPSQRVQAAAPAAPAAEPPVVARVAEPQPAVAPEPPVAVRVAEPERPAPRTVTIIDGISGKRQEVVIGGPEPPASGHSSSPARTSR
jgi:uncharacterized protein